MSKRIIELPDKVVQAIQNGEDYRYDIHTAIAQSTPYNPTGDCISREQIRKSLNKAFGCENATKYGNQNAEQQNVSYSTLMLYEIADIVEDCCDNAPTVADRYDEGYAQGYIDGSTGANWRGEEE